MKTTHDSEMGQTTVAAEVIERLWRETVWQEIVAEQMLAEAA